MDLKFILILIFLFFVASAQCIFAENVNADDFHAENIAADDLISVELSDTQGVDEVSDDYCVDVADAVSDELSDDYADVLNVAAEAVNVDNLVVDDLPSDVVNVNVVNLNSRVKVIEDDDFEDLVPHKISIISVKVYNPKSTNAYACVKIRTTDVNGKGMSCGILANVKVVKNGASYGNYNERPFVQTTNKNGYTVFKLPANYQYVNHLKYIFYSSFDTDVQASMLLTDKY